jgi:hypothetical protein
MRRRNFLAGLAFLPFAGLLRDAEAATMTDVSNLDDLARAISTGSAKIRNYAIAQAAATQAQEIDIQAALAQQPPPPPSGGGTDLGWINVKAYGATGNGSTDDTAAVQAALNAIPQAVGGTVYFPVGRYRINGALTCAKHGVALRGAGGFSYNGQFASVLDFRGASGVGLDLNIGSGVGHAGPVVEYLNFLDGNNASAPFSAPRLTLLRIRNYTHWTVRNCLFRGGLIGLDLDRIGAGGDVAWALIEQSHFLGNKTGVRSNGGPYTMLGGDIQIGGGAEGVGIYDTGEASNNIIGIKTEGDGSTSGQVGMLLTGQGSCVLDCGFEMIGGAAIRVAKDPAHEFSGRFAQIIGCGFDGRNFSDSQLAVHISPNVQGVQLFANTYQGYNSVSQRVRDEGQFTTRIDQNVASHSQSFQMKVKAGKPADSDFVFPPGDGTLIADSTGKLWVRLAGVWKGVAVV